jgi:hypothetical protein
MWTFWGRYVSYRGPHDVPKHVEDLLTSDVYTFWCMQTWFLINHFLYNARYTDNIKIFSANLRSIWSCIILVTENVIKQKIHSEKNCKHFFWFLLSVLFSGFGGLVVSMLASGTRVRGFDLRPKSLDFSGNWKIHSMPSFGGEVKESVPCPSFGACKRT